MQAGYWIRHRLRLPLPQLRNALVGHIILFVARMAFVVAASIFGFVFIVRSPELQSTQLPLCRFSYRFVCIVLLHTGAGAIGKSIDRAEPKSKERLSNSSLCDIHNPRWRVVDAPLSCDFNRAAKYFATTKQSPCLIVRKLMKNLLPLLFALVLGVACFVPAPASAYYYHGRYYRYSYRGHYYPYRYHAHYYRHRAWVVGVNGGRAGYYRYW